MTETIQEPGEIASLTNQPVAVRLVGAKEKNVRHGKVMLTACKAQKDGPPISTGKVVTSGALSTWAGSAVTVTPLQIPLREAPDRKSRAAGE